MHTFTQHTLTHIHTSLHTVYKHVHMHTFTHTHTHRHTHAQTQLQNNLPPFLQFHYFTYVRMKIQDKVYKRLQASVVRSSLVYF